MAERIHSSESQLYRRHQILKSDCIFPGEAAEKRNAVDRKVRVLQVT